jgi:ABC-type multidrug transport system fused ATPase/permease subunit
MTKQPTGRLGVVLRSVMLMTRGERLGAATIVGLMMVAGFFESAVVAMVLPIVYVLVDPNRFVASDIGRSLLALVGMPIEQLFPALAAGLAVLLLMSAAISSAALYGSEKHSAQCRSRLSRDLLRRMVAAPHLWLLKRNTVVLARHIHDDVRGWRRDFIQGLLQTVQAIIMIVSPATVVIVLAPVAGLVALAAVALICGIVVYAFRRKIRIASARSLGAQDAFSKSLMQILAGLREVKISGHADYFAALFDRHHRIFNELGIKTRMWGNAPVAMINLLGQLGFIATAIVLWASGVSGTEAVAQLALIAVVVSRVVPAFNRLSGQVAVLFRAAPVVEKLLALIAEIDAARAGQSEGGDSVPQGWRRIVLDDVWFRYPAADGHSIERVSLELERGRSYGFVGRSGAGKTTLVNLLLGLIEPTRGSIRIDGRPLAELSLSDWHRRFGYVPQDPFVLDGSLRENILFGETQLDPERLSAAISVAQLEEMVAGLARGLDTAVGERGRRLSGGQAQRLAIARAIYRRPEVLFLDEATSALDSITEARIQSELDAIGGDMLQLIVAHRVATLRQCDRIFMLEGGRIVETGSYDELVQRSELFRGLAAREPASA